MAEGVRLVLIIFAVAVCLSIFPLATPFNQGAIETAGQLNTSFTELQTSVSSIQSSTNVLSLGINTVITSGRVFNVFKAIFLAAPTSLVNLLSLPANFGLLLGLSMMFMLTIATLAWLFARPTP